jgi:hypothetical protein
MYVCNGGEEKREKKMRWVRGMYVCSGGEEKRKAGEGVHGWWGKKKGK